MNHVQKRSETWNQNKEYLGITKQTVFKQHMLNHYHFQRIPNMFNPTLTKFEMLQIGN